MSRLRRGLFWTVSLLLAGCATGPHANFAHVPDWQDAASPAAEAPQPAQAAPVAAPPAPSVPAQPSVAASSQSFSQGWVPLTRWAREAGLPAPVHVPGDAGAAFELRGNSGVLTVRSGSPVAHWDGLELRLGFAPELIDGQPWVHSLDLAKTIQPLLQGERGLRFSINPIVVLDPGHGGADAGTRSVLGNGFEKEFTLDWARRVQELLVTNGWQVFLTRSNDSDLALSNRVAFAEERQASVFLSLHFNSSAPSEAESGLETYCLTPAGMPSNLTRGFSDDLSAVFANNSFDTQNLELALSVHRALLEVNGHRDRGVRRARFPGVLRGQQRPAILIEGGYLSNPREARLISDPAYRQKLAEAVARALEECVKRDA